MALITVLVVLAALALIATPFALSMRGLESVSLSAFRQEAARRDALGALAAATRHLESTFPLLDVDSPHRDDLRELAPADLPERFPGLLPRDPRGRIAAVSIEDESGKVPLATASVWLLANLLGGRATLAADVDEHAVELPLSGVTGFAETGLVWVGQEIVEYSRRSPAGLGELRRGRPSTALLLSRARSHRAGEEVLDARLLFLAQHAWRWRTGEYSVFRRADSIREIATWAEAGYGAEVVERVRGAVSVHAGEPVFGHVQRVRRTLFDRAGRQVLVVADGSRCGPGRVLRLTDAGGAREFALVVSATRDGEEWQLALVEPLALAHDARSTVERLVPLPVNLLSAQPVVLAALFAGLGRAPVVDVVSDEEAEALAVFLTEGAAAVGGESWLVPPAEVATALAAGLFSLHDVTTAVTTLSLERVRPGQLSPAELALRLAGLQTRRSTRRIAWPTAELVAARVLAGQPGSHEELRALLDGLVAEGELDAVQRNVILRNAVDPGDAEITGGTAPFTYASAGSFTLRAAASRNLPGGREEARAFVRQVVSVAPEGESASGLNTQRDFEQAAALSLGTPGWTSLPRALQTGALTAAPGAKLAPPSPAALMGTLLAGGLSDPAAAITDALGPFSGALDPAAGRSAAEQAEISRAATLLAGRPGAAESERAGAITPATVRSALPDTLHMDDGRPGLTGDTPAGVLLASQPVVLPLDGVRPALRGGGGLLRSFAVEFWFTPLDLDAEVVLFDAGVDEVEDRVLIALADRQLLLRVDDTAIKDFQARMPPGRAPPAGEIRYAFDDGLELQAGMPYHVLAWIGGSRDRDLVLFVDGVPRGQRSFTTRLTAGVGRGGGGTLLGAGELRLPVESTAGFPQRGVLRIGPELFEYVDTVPDAFLVRSEGAGDPFGGRARRGSPGAEHEAGETVELMGWTLQSLGEPVARGNGTLASALGPFTVAELDPTALSDPIEVSVQPSLAGALPVTLLLGTGLSAAATTLPLRSSGPRPLRNDSFAATGGHAIVFCDYGNTAIVGASVPGATPGSMLVLPALTLNGWLGGAEVIRYAGFDGARLTGVQRAAAGVPAAQGGAVSDLASGRPGYGPQGRSGPWADSKEFVTTFDPALLGALTGLPDTARVLVVPISVPVAGGDLHAGYHPFAESAAGATALVQLGLDFNEGDDGTEWCRWDSATTDSLVRDDATDIDDMLAQIVAAGLWDPSAAFNEGQLFALRDELRFRGQAGTRDAAHVGGARVLPVHVLAPPDGAALLPITGLPGRHDAVTLVDPAGDREWQRINWATTTDGDFMGRALVAFREAVSGTFVRSDELAEESQALAGLDLSAFTDASIRSRIERLNIDSRLLVRMLCPPSGELPARVPAQVQSGLDFAGRPAGAALLDELRFDVAQPPGALLPGTGRYILREELSFEEERSLRLFVDALLFPHGAQRQPILGGEGLAILAELPQGGGLLLVGQEIVAFAGLDPDDSGNVYLAARGLYGSPRSRQREGTPVVPLLFWPASPLASALSETAAHLPLVEAQGFPEQGGLVLVGGELIEYTARDAGGLLLPERASGSRLAREGLLRGRFGTRPEAHPAGTLVRWFPARYRDAALPGSGVPESRNWSGMVRAPGAFFTELALGVTLPDPALGLELRVVPDLRFSPHAEPERSPGLLAASLRATQGGPQQQLSLPLLFSADRVDLTVFAVWQTGAFDAQTYGAQGWKLAPEVNRLAVGHVVPTLVFEHEEHR